MKIKTGGVAVMEIIYGIVEEKYILNDATRFSYGVVAYSNPETDGTLTIVASARDISADKERISALVKACNDGKLSLIHFNNVIEDFLSE
jgi:hypothetical protein